MNGFALHTLSGLSERDWNECVALLSCTPPLECARAQVGVEVSARVVV